MLGETTVGRHSLQGHAAEGGVKPDGCGMGLNTFLLVEEYDIGLEKTATNLEFRPCYSVKPKIGKYGKTLATLFIFH